MENEVLLGDCKDTLKRYPAETFDALITDPPYGYKFMNVSWDKSLPSVDALKECCRVLKSGAFAFFMCAPRQDVLSRMIIRLEDAGFQTGFTSIYWAYATGFPKAANMGKLVDKRGGKMLGVETCGIIKSKRTELGLSCTQLAELGGFYGDVNHGGTVSNWETGRGVPTLDQFNKLIEILHIPNEHPIIAAERNIIGKNKWTTPVNGFMPDGRSKSERKVLDITESTTPEAKQLDGSFSGFQPKPAVEIIIVCMKSLSEKTYVDQALKNGKGVTWLSDCRIPYEDSNNPATNPLYRAKNGYKNKQYSDDGSVNYKLRDEVESDRIVSPEGRFPANLLVSDDVLNDGIDRKSGGRKLTDKQERNNPMFDNDNVRMGDLHHSETSPNSGSFSRYFDLDAWFKSKLPEQAQLTYPYLIVPKPAKSEKNKYCENKHPTVKPLKLMSYLITMGSREGDVILDPFAGSGTTLEAARVLNRKFVGCELTEEYKDIIEARAGVSITSDPYRNVIEVTERNELTIEQMEESLTDSERDSYEGLLIEAPYEIFETVRKAYFMGKGLKV